MYIKILIFFIWINALFGATFTVGAGGDFATISAAISASKHGDTLILLANNTFTVASSISVSKALTIQGEDKTTCIITTSPATVTPTIDVRSSNVTLKNFTVRNNYGDGYSISVSVIPKLADLVFDNLIITGSSGIFLTQSTFQITNCSFNVTQTEDVEALIVLNGNQGSSIISNNTWTNSEIESINAFVFLTGGSDPFLGSLEISNNYQVSGPFSSFFLMDTFYGANFTLIIDENSYSGTEGGIAFSLSEENQMDIFSLIRATNNTDAGSHSIGIITIGASGGPYNAATNPSLLFEMHGNSNRNITLAPFVAATGFGQIAYNSDELNPFHVALPPYDLEIYQREERFPLQGDIAQTIRWKNADSQNIQGFSIYCNSTSNRINQTSSTFFENHNLRPGSLMNYFITSFDGYGNESRAMTISN